MEFDMAPITEELHLADLPLTLEELSLSGRAITFSPSEVSSLPKLKVLQFGEIEKGVALGSLAGHLECLQVKGLFQNLVTHLKYLQRLEIVDLV